MDCRETEETAVKPDEAGKKPRLGRRYIPKITTLEERDVPTVSPSLDPLPLLSVRLVAWQQEGLLLTTEEIAALIIERAGDPQYATLDGKREMARSLNWKCRSRG